MVVKCKMCGGELSILNENNICECEYCGTQQTIPTADNEKKINLFNRANRLRMNAEFDKAATVYASITAEFPEEAEAYWGLCLCKYGIEYVDDPLTGNKIPTCHRTLPESIMDDSDFDQACEYADAESKRLYREEAKAIDRLQQDILSIVASEEPFDVFICYKETDENGDRTIDSELAQEIYDFLTEKGLKVFFARITLEDKLGKQYEPYIYAALHSAKVMLAVGTKYEYYDAVWVKNEWARFLDMMRSDKSKTLIPCFKGIDAYDMPREFKNLQALDMGKIGWKQDLVRGIKKLTVSEEKVRARQPIIQTYAAPGTNVENLMKRARLFMEDGEFDNALEYLDKVLDENAEYAPAYVAKVCIPLKYQKEEDLKDAKIIFTQDPNWKKAIRFATLEQKTVYNGYASAVLVRIINSNLPLYEKPDECIAAKNALVPYSDCDNVPETINALDKKVNEMTLYKQRMDAAQNRIKNAKEKFDADMVLYNGKLRELETETKRKKKEINDRIDENEKLKRKLTEEELQIGKGLFTGKKRQELLVKRTSVNKLLDMLSQQYKKCQEEYDNALTMLQEEKPDENKLKCEYAKAYYDNELYEEAALSFYVILDYEDTRSFVDRDNQLQQALKKLMKKAIERENGKKTEETLLHIINKDFSKEEDGYCSQDVDAFIDEIIVKSFISYTKEEKKRIGASVISKEFNLEETGYSKTEVRKALVFLHENFFNADNRIRAQLFVNEMKALNSLAEITEVWEKYKLASDYPAVNTHIRRILGIERKNGSLQTLKGEKIYIETMLGLR